MSQAGNQKSVVRMGSDAVLELRKTIASNLDDLINEFSRNHPIYSETSVKTWKSIISIIDSVSQSEANAQTNEQPKDVESRGEQTSEQPDGSSSLSARANDEEDEQFGYSTEFFNLLCAKVRELIEMMRHADDENWTPLSYGSIRNVGMSLCRRIFAIANEEVVRRTLNQEIVYPYVCIEPALTEIMRSLFLKIYFSPICDKLVPLYVYSAIPLCQGEEKENSPNRAVYFNNRFPFNGIGGKEDGKGYELDKYHAYGRVRAMKENNPPGSKPYNPEEGSEAFEDSKIPPTLPPFNEKEYPSLDSI